LEKVKNILFGSVFDVIRFVALVLLFIIFMVLCFFSVDFDIKNYDMVLTSRIKTGTYYGLQYGQEFELWKIEKSEDGSLYTQRLYP
jgi:hypothetical protein